MVGASVGVVHRVLSDGDFDALGSGQLVAPDGRTYTRRSTRMRRRDVDGVVAAGSPVVTWSPGGALVWHDGDDAGPAWGQERPLLTAEAPDPARRESVTAGRWETADGCTAVVLIRHH